jgi:hypothetical protein
MFLSEKMFAEASFELSFAFFIPSHRWILQRLPYNMKSLLRARYPLRRQIGFRSYSTLVDLIVHGGSLHGRYSISVTLRHAQSRIANVFVWVLGLVGIFRDAKRCASIDFRDDTFVNGLFFVFKLAPEGFVGVFMLLTLSHVGCYEVWR